MSDHVIELLGAFLDGELHSGQLRKVKTHLDDCQACQEEYQALQALSAMLHEEPVPDFPVPGRLTADVMLRLPRYPAKPMSHRVLEVGWWLAPIGLIVAWIFISTTALISNTVTAANEFGLLNTGTAWLVAGSSGAANYSAFFGQFGFLENNSLQWLVVSEKFLRTFISSIFWQVSLATLYLSWFALWWARQMFQGLGQPLES